MFKEDITIPEVLSRHIDIDVPALTRVTRVYPMRINQYFLHLMIKKGAPLIKQVVPDPIELEDKVGLIDPLIVDAIEKDLAERHCIIPMFKVEDTLTVAMAEPQALLVVDDLERAGDRGPGGREPAERRARGSARGSPGGGPGAGSL